MNTFEHVSSLGYKMSVAVGSRGRVGGGSLYSEVQSWVMAIWDPPPVDRMIN